MKAVSRCAVVFHLALTDGSSAQRTAKEVLSSSATLTKLAESVGETSASATCGKPSKGASSRAMALSYAAFQERVVPPTAIRWSS